MRGVVLLLVALTACSSSSPAANGTVRLDSAGRTVSVHVEIADTQAEREQGLMGRASLPETSGMAFVYPSPVETPFVMDNTQIPLSIAFWDRQGRILAILDMEPCEASPCNTYGSPRPYVGALEVNQGFFARNGIGPGDRVELERTGG